jgi:hypothetical protein
MMSTKQRWYFLLLMIHKYTLYLTEMSVTSYFGKFYNFKKKYKMAIQYRVAYDDDS